MMKKSGASCGLSFSCPAEIQSALQVATVAGFDFLVLPIVHPRFRNSPDLQSTRPYSFTRSDLLLTSSEWTSLVVGTISRYTLYLLKDLYCKVLKITNNFPKKKSIPQI